MPSVEKQENAAEIMSDTATFDFGSAVQMPEAGSVSMSKNETASPINKQRVPLSEKIPVAQGTRGTHINPLVDQLMKENKTLQSEKSLEELGKEESAAEFETQKEFDVKKETVTSDEFSGAEQEFYINVYKKKKHGKHDKSGGAYGTYYDVFSDDTL